ncbi:MAG: NAD-dependent epimerase/dehydratase family protein [bacterium]|nr:NAD-dependent epimerase/dehydratase family protein [bacterium]
MKPTLVTGANGHVGNNVCRLLRARGEPVRAMMRDTADPAPVADLEVEIVRGDIRDPDAVARAMDGAGRVYHTAAGFLMWSPDPERDIVRASVDGTRHVLLAAARAGVEKVLYVSTSGTIGFEATPDRVRTELDHNTTPHTPYFRGKIAAEREAFEIAERTGMPVTAVNPGFILGPRFWKPSESTRQVVDFLNQGLPVWFESGFGTVDVEDVARGALLGMERGRDRERYILSGDNVTVKQLLDLAAELSGVPAPRLRMPAPLLRVLATGMELWGRASGTRPLLDRAQVDEFAGTFGFVSSAKAQQELGFTYRPVRDVVRRTVAWALDRGFVPPARRAALTPHPSLAGAY